MTLSIYGSASLFIYMKLSSSTTGDLGLSRRVRLLETALVDRRVYAVGRLYFDLTTGSPSELQLAVRGNRRNARRKYMNPGKCLGVEHCTLDRLEPYTTFPPLSRVVLQATRSLSAVSS